MGGVRGDERLGVYLDDVYRVDESSEGRQISCDRSFLLFVCAVGERFGRLVLFGRTIWTDEPADYLLPGDVEIEPLPHYSNLHQIGEVTRGVTGTIRGLWRGLGRVDAVWAFGPHPFAVALVVMAAVRRKRVILGVRQDSVKLYEARLGRRWSPAMMAVRSLDAAYRLFARRYQTTVQGVELAQRYGGEGSSLLLMSESVVEAADVVHEPLERAWDGTLELLTVGRLETEKNPLLLIDALARLEANYPGRFRLTWVGRGPLEAEVLARSRELGVDHLIDLKSYVPFGPELLGLYRRANMFVHVSLTEGMPKVLIEAMASSTPIVATDVGGVRRALADGEAGLLVPPADCEALVGAVVRLGEDETLRDRLVRCGLELARELTLEAQLERLIDFLQPQTSGLR
jgi:glycosyltransferase involved in cell wall biosynthesis